MKEKLDEKTVSYPLRLPGELDEMLAQAAKKTGMTKAGLTKLCLEVGMRHIERCDYSLADAILEASTKAEAASHGTALSPLKSVPKPRSTQKSNGG